MGVGLFGVPWSIVSIDPEVSVLQIFAQPPVAGAQIEQAPNLAILTAPASTPTVQWVSPGVRKVTIEGVLAAGNILVDLRSIREDLVKLHTVDPVLGRAPRVSMQWGDDEITGFAEIRQRVVKYWATGEPNRVEITITVTEAIETSIEGVSGGGETFHATFGRGETFESLARRYLGDPAKGDLIRRVNPRIARDVETPGTRVRVFERTHPEMRAEVRPVSPCFAQLTDGTRPWEPLIETLAAARGDRRGYPLRLLPELAGWDG